MNYPWLRAVGVLIGLALIWWVVICIRRGRLPVRAGFQNDYFLRGHDGIGFWLVACFYGGLGIAIIVTGNFGS